MSNSRNTARSFARLIAVQALFSVEATRAPYQEVMALLRAQELPILLDEEIEASAPDFNFANEIVKEAIRSQSKIDKATNAILKEGWPLKSIDPTLRAIFRAASAELLLGNTPPKVVINEYLDVSKAFDDDKSTTAFVNAVIDRIRKEFEAG